MQLSRIDAGELARLGGTARTSERLRSLIPEATSVEEPVREILARVRAEGDAAVLDYTRRFDTEGGEPSPLLVREEGANRPDIRRILQSASPRHAYLLAEELFAEISGVETPEGITAIAGIPRVDEQS